MAVQDSSPSMLGDPEIPDDELIARVLAGDRSAYDRLVMRHGQRLVRMLEAKISNAGDAEDIAQEALAQAYFKLGSFAGKSAFFTWLYRIAVNLSISHRRKRRLESTHQRTPIDPVGAEAQSPPADHSLTQLEQQQGVQKAIADLTPERREVLMLRDIEGLNYEEISDLLDIPEGTVRSRLHRARLDLRAIFIRQGLIEQ